MKNNLVQDLTENGFIPDHMVRLGIRTLLKQRLEEIRVEDNEATGLDQINFISEMDVSPIAVATNVANDQHYEIPQAFYKHVLGPHGKYSCCYWDDECISLGKSEIEGLKKTCEHADLKDGLRILELGCGWGSLTLWIARHYPKSHITAVSNSSSQGDYIRQRAQKENLHNVHVITADMNDFDTDEQFDRVVSVEMFEHMRNYRELFGRVGQWLKADGKFFMHIFTHRNTPYLFEDKDESDWMTRFFFTGGMMPSEDLPLFFQDDLLIEKKWRWNGTHYQKTSEAWLNNLDSKKEEIWPTLVDTYGADFAKTWYMRWRMFFLAVSELFGYRNGNEWYVTHYLFNKRV